MLLELAMAALMLGPQGGPQEVALSSSADIVIMGGANGGGKTWTLLYEPLRHKDVPQFGAVIFRRESPQITNQGGLWDEASALYPALGATPNLNALSWTFPSGARVRFSHLQHAKDRFAWDGAQIPLIGFDQLESFEEIQFWFLASRNRTTCGVRPYLRATCNPVPDDDPTGGWLHRLISWWLDEETGYARQDRAGVIRWFVRIAEELHWGATPGELLQRFPGVGPDDLKSLTFVPARLDDNPILTRKDPGYRGWLMSLPLVERERRLGGNWKIKPTAGTVFDRAWFKSFLTARPTDIKRWVRYWDKAGTEKGGKYSAGALLGLRADGRVLIADIVRGQWSALNRETVIKQTAQADAASCGSQVAIWTEQEPGSGGKESAENTIRNLAGHTVRADRVTGDKVTRAGPLSAQAEAGNVDILVGSWNEAFLNEAQNFDGSNGFSDQVDACSGAYNKLLGKKVYAGGGPASITRPSPLPYGHTPTGTPTGRSWKL